MASKKSAEFPENLDLYTELMSSLPGIEVKGATMPYTSLNGNMFSFLKEGAVGLRLSKEAREEFLKNYKTTLFETYGTVMKEYVTVSAALLKESKELKPWIIKSHDYAKTLKAKPTKKK
jgi:TfoX/Sxy family transcriptional regulator of competence genes